MKKCICQFNRELPANKDYKVELIGLDEYGITDAVVRADSKGVGRCIVTFASMHDLQEYNEWAKKDRKGDYYNHYIHLNKGMAENELGIVYVGGSFELFDSSRYAPCADCGHVHDRDDMTEVASGDLVCQSCLEDYYSYCEHCDEYCRNDDFTEVVVNDHGDTEYWCGSCVDTDAFVCPECGRTFDGELGHEVGNECYCDNCFSENFVECAECGEILHIDDAYWSDADGEYYCRDCYRERGSIRGYHNNPDIRYHYADDEDHDHRCFIGTEVETECGDLDERVRITREWGNEEEYIYQMHDGSLDSSGIECITQPMSKKFFDNFDFEGWMADLTDAGARSHDTCDCGLHVHLSREWLKTCNSDEQAVLVGRMKQFISDNQIMVERFCRRSSNHWCDYQSSYDRYYKDDLTKDEKADAHKKNAKCGDRYQSVNNRNYDTIEFRIFRGTLNANSYRASVEFCLRLVDYVLTKEDGTENWYDFLSYKPLPESMERYLKQRNLSIN